MGGNPSQPNLVKTQHRGCDQRKVLRVLGKSLLEKIQGCKILKTEIFIKTRKKIQGTKGMNKLTEDR